MRGAVCKTAHWEKRKIESDLCWTAVKSALSCGAVTSGPIFSPLPALIQVEPVLPSPLLRHRLCCCWSPALSSHLSLLSPSLSLSSAVDRHAAAWLPFISFLPHLQSRSVAFPFHLQCRSNLPPLSLEFSSNAILPFFSAQFTLIYPLNWRCHTG
jgi:hypothetical protein